MKKLMISVIVMVVGMVAFLAPIRPVEAQVMSNQCCDVYGNVKCLMPVYGPVGGSCFCFGQGNGYIC